MMGRPRQNRKTSYIHFLLLAGQLAKGIERSYHVHHVIERIWTTNGEANEGDMRVWILQWSERAVIPIATGVHQSQLDIFTVDFYIA